MDKVLWLLAHLYKSNLSFAAMNFVKRNNYIGVQILLRD